MTTTFLLFLSRKLTRKQRYLLGLAVVTLLGTGFHTTAYAERARGAMAFPTHGETRSRNKILAQYPDYLKFVLHIGKKTDRRTTKKLKKTYLALKKKAPGEAARFLRGLRVEMNHKVDLLHLNPYEVTSTHPQMKRLVRRFLKRWTREANEHLFRAMVKRGRRPVRAETSRSRSPRALGLSRDRF